MYEERDSETSRVSLCRQIRRPGRLLQHQAEGATPTEGNEQSADRNGQMAISLASDNREQTEAVLGARRDGTENDVEVRTDAGIVTETREAIDDGEEFDAAEGADNGGSTDAGEKAADVGEKATDGGEDATDGGEDATDTGTANEAGTATDAGVQTDAQVEAFAEVPKLKFLYILLSLMVATMIIVAMKFLN